jgi:nucleotide-binding universal stress UspA family protein
MTPIQQVLCPIDFSEASRTSLPYAIAIARHCSARLTLLTVDDPLLAEVAAQASTSLIGETERELRRFCGDLLTDAAIDTAFKVVVGKPGPEILRAATDGRADLIVMSSQGRSGARKMFFGSTTERVLRDTTVPVFVTPAATPPPPRLSEAPRRVHRIIVPIDLSGTSARQAAVAAAIATVLSVPLLLVHVLEPVFVPYNVRIALGGVDAARRERAGEELTAVAATLPAQVQVESLVLSGDPSEEISKLVKTRDAHLIVIGLHSAGALGPRMGSVTYRILCLSHTPVLALPPLPT